MTAIGLVTIGQAPREDVTRAMFAGGIAGRWLQAGALDTLDPVGIGRLAPRSGEDPLVTRLRDGREVVVGERAVVPHLQAALDRVVRDGAQVAVVLCTGEFPDLSARVPIIFPDRVLRGVVDAILPAGRLGVLMPHPAQQALMARKWTTTERAIVCAAASPYTEPAALAERAHELARHGAELIVLDCMGYDRAMRSVVCEAAALPTILANRLVGRVVEELAER